jgi:hypothetical protein
MNAGELVVLPPKGLRFVYGIYDPEDSFIKYVGQTANPHVRLSEHFKLAKSTDIRQTIFMMWFRSVIRQGRVPEMVILEVVIPSLALKAERKWIKHYHCQNLILNADAEHWSRGRRKRKVKGAVPKPQRTLPTHVSVIKGCWYVRLCVTILRNGKKSRKVFWRRCDPETSEQAKAVHEAMERNIQQIREQQNAQPLQLPNTH